MQKAPVKPRLKDEYLRAIGHVTVQWSLLEHFLDDLIGILANVYSRRVGRALTRDMNMQTKLTALHRVIDLRLPDGNAKKYRLELLRKIKEASARRNDIIHALWAVDDEDEDENALRVKETRGVPIKYDITQVTAEEIEQLAVDISSLAEEVSSIR